MHMQIDLGFAQSHERQPSTWPFYIYAYVHSHRYIRIVDRLMSILLTYVCVCMYIYVFIFESTHVRREILFTRYSIS